MRYSGRLILLLLLLSNGLRANARQLEIHPYAGGFFPQKFLNLIKVNKEGVYGAKVGWFLTPNIETEGHFGYINNFSFEDTLTRKRAFIWEGGASYRIGPARRFYGVAGAGAVTMSISKDSGSFFDSAALTREKFLSISYGGGIKNLRRWGPVGYRAEVRGRTLPHFYGFRFSWLETTAGLTFSFNAGQSKQSLSTTKE